MSSVNNPQAMELLDILSDLNATMRPLLKVAQYVASAHSVLDAINGATRQDKALEKRMFQLHPTWRDPDFDGQTLQALSQLLMQAESALFSAQEQAQKVHEGRTRAGAKEVPHG